MARNISEPPARPLTARYGGYRVCMTTCVLTLAESSNISIWVVIGPWAATLTGAVVLGVLKYMVGQLRDIKADFHQQVQAARTENNQTRERVEEVYRRVQSDYAKKDTIELRLDAIITALGQLAANNDRNGAELREIRDRLIHAEATIDKQ